MISFRLEDEERMVAETARAFAEAEIRPALRACEAARGVPEPLWRAFRDLGLHALGVPAENGGAGLGAVATAVVAEELAWGDPGVAASLLASVPAVCAIRELAGAEAGRWLGPFVERGARVALAFSEADPPDAGFGVVAERRGGGWALRGRKAFVAYGGRAELHVVAAQIDPGRGWDGIGVFVVEPGASGLSATGPYETLGLRAVPFAEVVFDGCAATRLEAETPREALRRALLRASLLPAALAVGCARASYEYALRYAEERQAFGRPIGHFQAIAFMLSDMAMDVEAARWMVWRAAAAADRGGPDGLLTALAVSQAHEAATRVTDHGVQILGGHGYMRDHPQEKWMRDARTLASYVASPELVAPIARAAVLGAEEVPGDSLPLSGLQPMLT